MEIINPKNKQIKIQQSGNWWQTQDIDWFIENAQFAFTNKLYKGDRVRIVTKKKLDGRNCFEFDYDRYGIYITSASEYSSRFWAQGIIHEQTKDVVPLLLKFFEDWGCDEFVNPKPSFRLFFNKLFKKCKIVTINYKSL